MPRGGSSTELVVSHIGIINFKDYCRLFVSEDRKSKVIDIDLDFTRKAFDEIASLITSGAKGLEVAFSLDKEQLSFALSKMRDSKQWFEHQWKTGIEEFRLGVRYFRTEDWQTS